MQKLPLKIDGLLIQFLKSQIRSEMRETILLPIVLLQIGFFLLFFKSHWRVR